MKKYISVLLIICLMLPYTVFAQNANYEDSTTRVLFSDDFESEEMGKIPSKWKRDSGSDKKIYRVTDDPLFDGNKVFEVTSTAKSWQDGVGIKTQYQTNTRKDIIIKYRFYHLPKAPGADAAPGFRFVMRNQDGEIFYEFYCRNGNIIGINNAYTPGQWNEMEVRTNVADWTVELFVNGKSIGTKPMRNKDKYDAGSVFANYCFDAYDDAGWVGQSLIDDISVSEDCTADLQALADTLTFDLLSNEKIGEVTENLTLPPTLGSEGQYPIEWTSGNEEALTSQGAVTRRSFNQKAVLNAKITMTDGLWINKQFEINVLKLDFASDEDILKEYADFALNFKKLSAEEISAVTKDLTLPTDAPDGITVTWSSSNEAAISLIGKVTRPKYDEENANVTLTAHLTLNDATHDISHEVTVLKEENPFDKLKEAMDSVTYESLTSESADKLKKSIVLPLSHDNGTSITWSSDDESVISSTGKTTRADETKSVTLTAKFNYNGYEDEKSFTFTVLLNDSAMVDNDLAKFTVNTETTEDFYLPMSGEDYQTTFTWVSSDTARIKIRELSEKYRAEVIRPVFEAGDCDVTLTLTAINGTESRTLAYPVKVLKQESDKDIADAAYSKLKFSDISSEDINSVTQNLSLMNSLDNGISVEWYSDNEDIVTSSGEVFNPVPSSAAATVNLSAVLKRNYYTSEPKVFTMTVKPFDNDEELYDKIKSGLTFDKLSNEDIENVKSDLTLPRSWYYNSTIEWTSNSGYLKIGDNTAEVTRPEYGAGKVTAVLTAKITCGDEILTKSFEIKIPEKNYLEMEEDIWSESCSGWITGGTDFVSSVGKWTLPEDEITYTAEDDPTDANNTVIKMVTGSNNGSNYLEYNYKSTMSGEIIAGMRCYIEGDNSRLCVEVTGNVGTLAVLNFNPGGIIFLSSQYPEGGSKYTLNEGTYPKGEWFDIRVELDTVLAKYHVYINGTKLTEYGNVYLNDELYDSTQGVPFNYYKDRSTNVYGYRLSQWKLNSKEEGTAVYFDDFYYKKRMVYTEEQLAAATLYERELLKNNNINMLLKNLVVPKIEYKGITITSQSSNKSILSDSGVIKRADEDRSVEWTASFDDGVTVYKRVYTITIGGSGKEELTDEESAQRDVQYAIEYLKSNYLLSALKENIVFPVKGKYGSVLSYTSSNTSAITDAGIITRASYDSTSEITVTAVKNEASAYDTVSITVIKSEPTSGGGGGGGGSSSSGSSSKTNTKGNLGGGIPAVIPTVKDTPIQNTQTFNDVDSSYWAYDAVEYLAKNKIISGNENGDFEPGREITREEFVKLLASALKLTDEAQATSFTDISSGAWYEKYIAAAVNKGIVNGISDTEFGIGLNVTRQDLAVMLYRAAKFLPETKYTPFGDDSEISDYAKDAIYTLKAYGIISGKSDNEFAPLSQATRAEAATMIYRMIKNSFI